MLAALIQYLARCEVCSGPDPLLTGSESKAIRHDNKMKRIRSNMCAVCIWFVYDFGMLISALIGVYVMNCPSYRISHWMEEPQVQSMWSGLWKLVASMVQRIVSTYLYDELCGKDPGMVDVSEFALSIEQHKQCINEIQYPLYIGLLVLAMGCPIWIGFLRHVSQLCIAGVTSFAVKHDGLQQNEWIYVKYSQLNAYYSLILFVVMCLFIYIGYLHYNLAYYAALVSVVILIVLMECTNPTRRRFQHNNPLQNPDVPEDPDDLGEDSLESIYRDTIRQDWMFSKILRYLTRVCVEWGFIKDPNVKNCKGDNINTSDNLSGTTQSGATPYNKLPQYPKVVIGWNQILIVLAMCTTVIGLLCCFLVPISGVLSIGAQYHPDSAVRLAGIRMVYYFQSNLEVLASIFVGGQPVQYHALVTEYIASMWDTMQILSNTSIELLTLWLTVSEMLFN